MKAQAGDNRPMPVVSIVTTSYNRDYLIEETIKSIVNQDYPNIDYIIVDGGSTDSTLEILKKYEGRLRWVSEKDKGAEDAFNKGGRMARGEIIAWVNSDDTLLPGAVSKVVDYFNKHPDVTMVYGNGYFTDSSSNVIGIHPTEPFDLKRLAVCNYICHPSVFTKKDAVVSIGGYSMTSFKHASDYDLYIRVAKRYKVGYIPEFLATYRIHPEAKSTGGGHILAAYRESLYLVMRYYNWAPMTRVFPYYYHFVKSKFPVQFIGIRVLVMLIASFVSVWRYIILNKGIRLDDFRYIKFNDIKRFIFGWDLVDELKRTPKGARA